MRPVSITVYDADGGGAASQVFTTSPIRIGRNPLNDLVLAVPFVSGWHAVVRFDAWSAKYFDLGSTNGTVVEGRRLGAGEAIALEANAQVTIGRLTLRFERLAEPDNVTALGEVPGDIQAPAGAATSESTAHVQLAEAHACVNRLRPRYEAYRSAWASLHAELGATLGDVPTSAHAYALALLQREFSQLVAEPEFRELAEHVGAALHPDPAPSGTNEAVTKLARSLRPGEPPPRTPAEVEGFLDCIGLVLTASAKAFVELQRGQEQFGQEMGIRTLKEFTPLHAAGTPENVLRYLLDPAASSQHRTQELVGVYADLMIHQVALLNGVMEGVRALLARLAPAEFERSVTAAWPTRATALWRAYVENHQRLRDHERDLTAIVFGPDFARAYAEVGGEGTR